MALPAWVRTLLNRDQTIAEQNRERLLTGAPEFLEDLEIGTQEEILPGFDSDELRTKISKDYSGHPALRWLLDGYWLQVASSNVDEISYDYIKRELGVKFLNGAVYLYGDVPPEIAANFFTTDSPGRYVWTWLRDIYPYRKVRNADTRTEPYPKTARVIRGRNDINIAEQGYATAKAELEAQARKNAGVA